MVVFHASVSLNTNAGTEISLNEAKETTVVIYRAEAWNINERALRMYWKPNIDKNNQMKHHTTFKEKDSERLELISE